MKRHFNLFERIATFEALYRAHLKARRGKRDRVEVMRFTQNLESNLLQLESELLAGTYRTGDYRYFRVFEPKERTIAVLPYRDRVVQHALNSAIEPPFERSFHHDSYACRLGKGMHAGADRAQQFLRQVERSHGRAYVLKADIAKYFNNIDHGVLKRLLRRRIGCPRTLALCDNIIDSSAVIGDLAPKGLPIGNLVSQLWANVYLHELDDFVKHGLRERRYLRYADDFAVIHHDKAHLHRIRHDIEVFLWDQLRLTTNHKTQVFPVSNRNGRGFDFLGYKIWPHRRRVRKDSVLRMRKKMRRLQRHYAQGRIELDDVRQVVASWVGHVSHADSEHLRAELLGQYVFRRPPL
jgi:retron-type reverse transcriptase